MSGGAGIDRDQLLKENAALYYPWIRALHPLKPGIVEDFPPCGAVAGIYARTDATRGVWKAPAGIDAGVRGVAGLGESPMPRTACSTRAASTACATFRRTATSCGARGRCAATTSSASSGSTSRSGALALFIEESLFRGTKWVVFEPNDEPLWAQIRLNVGAFMHGPVPPGRVPGQHAREAYFVKCDKDTTTQNDINLGIVNILVGFAPLKPAEFVVLKIQQIAGQVPADE